MAKTPKSTTKADRPGKPHEARTSTTKKQRILDVLEHKDGATLQSRCAATGWQPHSVRACLSTLRKAGLEITCTRASGTPALYRLSPAEGAVAHKDETGR